MTKRTAILTVAAVLVAASAFAQNPCTAPLPTNVSLNPTKLQAQLTEQTVTLPDGSPSVTEYQVGWFVKGAANPIQTTTVQKTAWTLIAGTTDCYEATTGAAPVSVGPTVYESAIKARRVPGADGSAAEESAWSTRSNPFGRTAAPLTPPRVVVR